MVQAPKADLLLKIISLSAEDLTLLSCSTGGVGNPKGTRYAQIQRVIILEEPFSVLIDKSAMDFNLQKYLWMKLVLTTAEYHGRGVQHTFY